MAEQNPLMPPGVLGGPDMSFLKPKDTKVTDFSSFMSTPAAQAGMLQLGVSLMAGLGDSRVPLGTKLALALTDAASAMQRGNNPQLDPVTLEAQKLQVQATKPYWDKYLADQQLQNQLTLSAEQFKNKKEGLEIESEADAEQMARRRELQQSGLNASLTEIQMRQQSEEAVNSSSDKLARERILLSSAADIAAAERKAALEVGVKTLANNGYAMTSQDTSLYGTILKSVQDSAFDSDEELTQDQLIERSLSLFQKAKQALTGGPTTSAPLAVPPTP